ncbi:MAG: glycosyl transferase [Roseobacter sp. MedPE-SW]|nr:MAG: glycosyl transferase [Roseobacter sp. MedPE-SW]
MLPAPEEASKGKHLRLSKQQRSQGPSAAECPLPPSSAALRVQGVYRADALALRSVDLSKHRPSAALLKRMPASFWLRHCAIPWVQLGDTIAIAFASAEEASRQERVLTECFGPFIPVLAPEAQITPLLVAHFKTAMARRASNSIAPELSSKTLFQQSKRLKQWLPVSIFLSLAALFPLEVFSVCCGAALLLLVMFTALKLCGLVAYLFATTQPSPLPADQPDRERLPKISMLVPLYKEAEISSALLKRLARLTYPQDRMEVLLVLEEGDQLTRETLSEATLPHWVSAIEVPAWGELRTKPRAMNYALNFCKGDIIGVWDAEDAPQPDQLLKVAAGFATAPPEVACFQGVLDYYNPRANWISRCFTLEYASWFRIVLQGIARLNLVVPLGGTTMFVRRSVLDRLGGWDAHNVTEDADLGVRLYYAGYRTRMLPTATYEEASCHLPAWIRQRSRWLKGFMATYLVHMRHPLHLARRLGWAGFLGFQAFFLGTIGQFLLAPFLWTYWLVFLGLPHPSASVLPDLLLFLGVSSLLFFEALGISIAVFGAFASGRPKLALWAPLLPIYYLMGPIAVYKALYELLYNPFFWDKTSHGMHPPDCTEQEHMGVTCAPAKHDQ